MNQQATTTANPYLRTKVLTAGPLELRLMLYDGAIKFCRQARHALARRDYETSYHGLMRAQKIMLELSNSLRREVEPELCERMAGLYNYLYRRLVDANMEREPAIVDACTELIEYERETWRMLMKRAGQQEEGDAPEQDPERGTGPAAAPPPAGADPAGGVHRNPLASIGPGAGQSSFSAEG